MIEALENLSEGRVQYYQAGYAIHELALKAKEIYSHKKTSPEDKRLLLSLIFSNLNINTNKITPNYTFGFEFLTKWVPTLNKNFEPPKKAENTHKTGDLMPVLPHTNALLRTLESFRTAIWQIPGNISPFKIVNYW